jgi:transcriptional regulator with XRE-family HTH domain
MADKVSTVAESATPRRRLTLELRRRRNEAGLTQRQVADKLDWSQSKVIRIEQGAVKIRVTDLQALLLLYGVTDPTTVGDLTTMARESKKLPFTQYGDILSDEAIRFFQYEADAVLIRQVALQQVPGILQVPDYSVALLAAYGIHGDRAARIVESRAERRELFDRPEPPEVFYILDEAILRRQVGNPEVMRRQLDHLVTMAERPNVAIQVLPFTLGAHPALEGPFIHLEFADEDDPDVIFVENTLGDTLFRADQSTTTRFREQFIKLESVATPPDEFAAFVAGLAG